MTEAGPAPIFRLADQAANDWIAVHIAELFDSLRPTPFERFFFREPVNGYVFEIIDADRARVRD